jgi:N-succinyldiaminopimelate aminotransferase
VKPVNQYVATLGTTIFAHMSALAEQHQAINLGQGAPDEDGPQDILDVAARATAEGPNQYVSMLGIPALREAVAAHDAKFYGITADPLKNILVTSGATEALAASLSGLLNPGDEVILIEPAYDSYLPIVRLAGATPKFLRLEAPLWEVTEEALAAVFSESTKLIILNTPMNPIGKIFNQHELELMASFVKRFDCYAICDEVYEHLIFDDQRHIPLMTLPGMWERCVRIGSAGKSFSLTGWKVGYITGPAELLAPITKVHQFLTFTTPGNLQKGVAYALAKDISYYDDFKAQLQKKRDLLASGLSQAGFKVLAAEGTYFLIADYSPLKWPGEGQGSDLDFCEWITREVGVAAIPLSSFYADGKSQSLIRFCFCKREEILTAAIARLSACFNRNG